MSAADAATGDTKVAKSFGQAVRDRLWRLYYQYLLVTAASTLEPVEIFIFNSLALVVMTLLGYYGYVLVVYCFASVVAHLPHGYLPDWLDVHSQAAAERLASAA